MTVSAPSANRHDPESISVVRACDAKAKEAMNLYAAGDLAGYELARKEFVAMVPAYKKAQIVLGIGG
jgi:hypothetical protein